MQGKVVALEAGHKQAKADYDQLKRDHASLSNEATRLASANGNLSQV